MEKKRNLKQRLKVGKTIFFKDVKHAKWAILSVFAYFVLLRKFFITICPAVLITGLPCPGCGMTRALIRLLHLDFAGAWQMHPFVYLFMILFCGSEYEDIYWEFLIQKKHGKFIAMLGILMILFISGGCSGIFPEIRQ